MRKLDIFGEPVRILLNKQFSVTTTVGGYFTILTIIMILVFTWFIGRDLIYKERPISYMQKDIFTKFENISINHTNFPFSFTMMDDDNVPLVDYSYLTLKLYEITYNIDPTTGIFDLTGKHERPVRFCKYSDFPLINEEQFEGAQLAYSLCPEKNDFNLYGYWNEADLNYLQISIERCKNETDSEIICKTPDKIEEFIAQMGTNLNIFYIDSRVRINNNTNPLEYLSIMQYKYVIPEYYKKTTYKIQSQNIMTDNGFVFSENDRTQFFRMIEEFTDIRVIDPDDYQFLVFEIFSSNISETYYRRYIKVPDIMASLGGILKVFTISFLTLNTIFSEVEKNISIVNEVFVLNRKASNTNSLPNLDEFSRRMDISSNQLFKKTEEKVLNNNFILPHPINSKKNNFSPPNNFDSINSKKADNCIDFPTIVAPLESQSSFSNKSKIKHFNSIGNKLNNLITDSNNKNNNNKNVNTNINRNNFFKQKLEEEEKPPNKSMDNINSTIEKYLSLRRSENKLSFGGVDILNIVCNKYCNKKIPKNFHEKFNFYEKARSSVEHYFDFLFIIKTFEEINILKNCLLSEEQSKMVEIMCKPILSSKILYSAMDTIKITEDSEGLYKDINDFINKFKNKGDAVDRKILKIIEKNVKKSHI